jgi:hypothetical protein
MRKLQITILFVLVLSFSFAQNVPNGSFEDYIIDTINPEWSYPSDWMPYRMITGGIECFPFLNQGEISNESNSGNWAIKMETESCIEFGVTKHKPGGFTTGNPGTFFPLTYAFASSERPDQLRFNYKFHPVGNDSAFVEVILFKYDTLQPYVLDTVGYAIEFLLEGENEYVLRSTTIDYVADGNPDFIHIEFGSGKNCTTNTCNTGTTLWVDDVSLWGGTIDLVENSKNKLNCKLFPNPTSHSAILQWDKFIQVETISIVNLSGSRVYHRDNLAKSSSAINIDVHDFSPGMYFVELITGEGERASKKLIIE